MSEEGVVAVISKPDENKGENKVAISSQAGGDVATPSLFDVYKAEGNALVKSEKYEEAIIKYDLAWKECKTDDDRAMILNNRGVVFEKLGDSDQAIATFNEALKLKPEYPKVLIRRGIVRKKQNRFADAIEDITEAHVLALKNQQTLSGLSEITAELVLDYAETELERMMAGREFGFPKDQFIRTYLRQFYCDPICRMWKGLDPYPMDENPNIPIQGFVAALDCLRKGVYPELTKHCTDEINSGGKYRLEAHLLRGSITFLSGQKDDALNEFKAVFDDPDASPELKSCAHVRAAMVANIWDDAETAASHFASAEQLWPQNADVYYHAALCLVDKGEAIPALALLEKGQQMCPSPKDFPLLHVMALTIRLSYDVCLGNPQESMAKLKQLEVDGVFDTPECYEYYAQTLLLLQSGDEAYRFFEKAVEVSGGERIFELKKVMAQQVFRTNTEETLAALKAFEDDPDVGNAALYHIGEIYCSLGKKEEAFAAIDKSIETSFCVYDMKIRIVGKIDFLYNLSLTDKMKKHGVELPDPNPFKGNCLE